MDDGDDINPDPPEEEEEEDEDVDIPGPSNDFIDFLNAQGNAAKSAKIRHVAKADAYDPNYQPENPLSEGEVKTLIAWTTEAPTVDDFLPGAYFGYTPSKYWELIEENEIE